jgi:tetratricopeptide (TPR) repeat protein
MKRLLILLLGMGLCLAAGAQQSPRAEAARPPATDDSSSRANSDASPAQPATAPSADAEQDTAGVKKGNPLARLKDRVKNQMSSGCANVIVQRCWDTQTQEQSPDGQPDSDNAPPRSDTPSKTPPLGDEESSSKQTKVDLTPPPGEGPDFRKRAPAPETPQMPRWDPHRAEKDVEVGDFYFKKQNYAAAASRYREALEWKSNDAPATIGLAQSLEKLGQFGEARSYYAGYLKILPKGPEAQKAREALERLKDKADQPATSSRIR